MKKPPKSRPKRVTLHDVAARARVSMVTASRALRRPEMVSLDLRDRVNAAARALAYVPNQLASALASRRTGRIGVIVPSLTNGVFNDYLRALHDVFVPADIQVLVLNSHYMPGREEKAILTMLGQFPEAIVLAGIEQTPHARKALQQAGIPVVQTMELAAKPIDINIGLSQQDAGYAAARHLFDLGHRHVGQISAPLDSRSLKRIDGYLQAVREFGATPMMVSVDLPSSIASGGELLGELLARWPSTTAIFCGNDNLALGALFECQRRGFGVPRDLSIVGFNDLEVAASACPSLSTIATPRYEMARRAGEIILEIIRGSGRRPKQRQIDLGFRLIARESTGELGNSS
ncbi:MAG: LacI family DNA-binding transcriptional regulator [Rhizobiales bacterium]|nr:LacI family DNA-binding transcriptional regulator [Hyphomicrobiales bacterium]MBI3671993.1 LacI family DNA-binding transcriptional regulator [Hyphomicrobiales bacterium]